MSAGASGNGDGRGIVLIGPGAIGGAVVGALVEGGHALRIAARRPFDELQVTHPGGQVVAPADCVASPSELVPAEIVLLAVKAHQTPAAAEWLAAASTPESIVFVLQNGVEHAERVRPFVSGATRVVPVVVALPAASPSPGQIDVAARGSLAVPRTSAAERLEALVECDFLRVHVLEDWTTAAWSKLMMNAAAGGMATLMRRDNRVFGKDEEAREIVLGLMHEIAAVARAEGAAIPDARAAEILDGVVRRAGPHLSSIVVDRIEGRPTEWDARNAVVDWIAKRHGIDVPMNRMLTALIRLGEPEG